VRAQAVADPVSFLAENGPPVIFDEVQAAPELLHYVKERIDEDRTPGNWLLTGSQSFGLMRGVIRRWPAGPRSSTWIHSRAARGRERLASEP